MMNHEIEALGSARPNKMLLMLLAYAQAGLESEAGGAVQVAAQSSICVRKATFNGQGF